MDKQSKTNVSEEEKMRHSLSHVLADAVLRIFPEAKLGIGPAIENGFYYDFDLPRKLNEEDLGKIETEMKKIIKEDLPITQVYFSRDEAMDILHQKGQLYKTELLSEITDEQISFFKTGNEFTDLCRGPHVKSTGKLKAFKLTSIAGAYWRGDEKRPQMQRIYGIGFKTEEDLNKHLENQLEMKKRDHRKLGKELELFLIDEMAGQGLIMWLPKGFIIRKEIENFEYQEQIKLGYQHVITPHIANVDLYKTSGHLEHYKDSMYPIMKIDEEEYVLRPMNCPHHIRIFASKIRSYRDLPYKIAEFATVYRYEKSGELSGLSRVRGFTQDDGHIFTTVEGIKEAVKETLDLTIRIFNALGFFNFNIRLSLRDPEDKRNKFINKPELWKKAENQLKEILEEDKHQYTEGIGEAAFYGPKIDFLVKDVFGREEQCGTIQLDFNLPERFKIKYTDEKGEQKTPVMIHRAPLGSFERFFSRLIENTGGAFPVWLAPVQARIIPISDKFNAYANLVKNKLEEKNIRVDIDSKAETLQSKIRESEVEKIPYMLVVGKKEQENNAVAVRPRSGTDLGLMKTEEFISRIIEEISLKK